MHAFPVMTELASAHFLFFSPKSLLKVVHLLLALCWPISRAWGICTNYSWVSERATLVHPKVWDIKYLRILTTFKCCKGVSGNLSLTEFGWSIGQSRCHGHEVWIVMSSASMTATVREFTASAQQPHYSYQCVPGIFRTSIPALLTQMFSSRLRSSFATAPFWCVVYCLKDLCCVGWFAWCSVTASWLN